MVRGDHWLGEEVVRLLSVHHGLLEHLLVLHLHLVLDLLELLLVAALLLHEIQLLSLEVARLGAVLATVFLIPERAREQALGLGGRDRPVSNQPLLRGLFSGRIRHFELLVHHFDIGLAGLLRGWSLDFAIGWRRATFHDFVLVMLLGLLGNRILLLLMPSNICRGCRHSCTLLLQGLLGKVLTDSWCRIAHLVRHVSHRRLLLVGLMAMLGLFDRRSLLSHTTRSGHLLLPRCLLLCGRLNRRRDRHH